MNPKKNNQTSYLDMNELLNTDQLHLWTCDCVCGMYEENDDYILQPENASDDNRPKDAFSACSLPLPSKELEDLYYGLFLDFGKNTLGVKDHFVSACSLASLNGQNGFLLSADHDPEYIAAYMDCDVSAESLWNYGHGSDLSEEHYHDIMESVLNDIRSHITELKAKADSRCTFLVGKKDTFKEHNIELCMFIPGNIGNDAIRENMKFFIENGYA